MLFYLRVIGITVLRFLAITVLILFIGNFEVSPLPGWTLTAFGFVMHFLLTYAFAHWTFRGRLPTPTDAAYVSLVFVLLGTAIEGAVFIALTRGSVRDLMQSFGTTSFFLVLLYVVAILLAAYDAKRKNVQRSLGEGLEG
jgi:hypothetical protein